MQLSWSFSRALAVILASSCLVMSACTDTDRRNGPAIENSDGADTTALGSDEIELTGAEPVYLTSGAVFLDNINVIDGNGSAAMPALDILIHDGRIQEIGDLSAPQGAYVIQGENLTVLPGLIDLHVHMGAPRVNDGAKTFARQTALDAMLYAGVTTALDLGSPHKHVVAVRDAIHERRLRGPRLVVVGDTIHRLQSVTSVFTATSPETKAEISGFLDQKQDDEIEIVKIYTGMSNWSARHLVAEAHAREMRVIADFWCTNLSRTVFEVTQVDAYAHGACRQLTADEVRWMADNDKFAMMTLTIFDLFGGHRVKADRANRSFLKDPLIVDVLGEELVQLHYDTFDEARANIFEGPRSLYQQQLFGDLEHHLADNQVNVKALFDAGVLIGLGTDAPFLPGNFPGEAMHHEMQLHVEAGIPPLDVIQMATRNGAIILGLEDDIGSIEIGKVADLLIVAGDPSSDITDSRNVEYVIVGGRIIDREALKASQRRAVSEELDTCADWQDCRNRRQ